ncbi:MAG TPA: hypothetical protein VF807_04985 [Ktedonobacterales bacterium]
MQSAWRKTDLSPVETLVVERTLGEEARRDAVGGLLARIQKLTTERTQLYAEISAYPWLSRDLSPQIKAMGVEIDMLWTQLRVQRARRRAEIERALNILAEDEERQDAPQPAPIPATRRRASTRPARQAVPLV